MSNKDLLRALCDTVDYQRHARRRRNRVTAVVTLAVAAALILLTAFAVHLRKPMDGGRADAISWRAMQQEAAGRSK